VAGDEDVGPSVLVEIERRDAEGVMAVGAVDMGFGGDVFKRAVTAVVVEDVLSPCQTARPAHDRNALPDAGGTFAGSGSGGEIEVYVVRYDKIKAAIAIVVDKGTACTPGLA